MSADAETERLRCCVIRRRNVIKKNGYILFFFVVRFTHASRILFKQRDGARARALTSFSSLPFVSKHVFSFSRCRCRRHCNELLQTERLRNRFGFLCYFFPLRLNVEKVNFMCVRFSLVSCCFDFTFVHAVDTRCERSLAATPTSITHF